ncbi:glucans biosynthesis glucosyltransferase MdoH [Geminisphaera colitermitum]|uniref:glucans biosynthesis glucosyltransferase MdoH n=1 Tax=Geminisphaera colitermitum TaxID=1148786 RepID=UPI000694C52E|nr:glucans biosynthesis glucosyltransferase MdoH [Geminisphaera colitermitum]
MTTASNTKPSSPPPPFDPAQLDAGRITQRRTLIATLTLLLLGPAVLLMADLHWRSGVDAWKLLHLVLFALLFGLVAFGAVQALIGFWIRGHRPRGSSSPGDPCRIIRSLADEDLDPPPPPSPPVAIVMPVCNEDPARILEGLRAIYTSLEATGQLDAFDFFILSDSSDPNRWIEEQTGWIALTRQLNAQGRIFYRKRRVNTNKKAGNIADFCRRWGRHYRHMVVLDADSIMSGPAITRLVRMMERNPTVGIIQTVPELVNGETVFARLQQFASRLYGPVFAAGLNFWQLGEANYWGHNAIIRLAPFIEHCSLPDLPGSEPFGGRILSHDYVEAALMRRGGWAVWLAVDLAEPVSDLPTPRRAPAATSSGSYEECPGNLIDFAKRDRRWLQGNLQHSWLLAARGLRMANRLHLALGIMAYLSSPLWCAFLVLSTLISWRNTATGLTPLPVDSFARYLTLTFEQQALLLFAVTLGLLFLPKALALLDLRRRPGEAAAFGGWRHAICSVLLETVLFTLMAPVMMLFHTKFILLTLAGRGVAWVTQRRGQDGEPEWREIILTHAGQTLLGAAWLALALWINPWLAIWMSPLFAGVLLAMPVSLLTGQRRLGQRMREWGLFCTPNETRPPPELATLRRALDEIEHERQIHAPLLELAPDLGLMQAVLDPYVNAVHVALLREKDSTPQASEDRFASLRYRLLCEGPAALTKRDKMALLHDAESMTLLHRGLWSASAADLSDWWRHAIRSYNIVSPPPQTALKPR